MFDFLKKKIGGFTDKLREKLQGEAKEEPAEKQIPEAVQEPQKEEPKPEPVSEKPAAEKIEEPVSEKEPETKEIPAEEETKTIPKEEETEIPRKETDSEESEGGIVPQEPEAREIPEKEEEKIIEEAPGKTGHGIPEKEIPAVEENTPGDYSIAGEEKSAVEKAREIRGEEKRELKAKVGLGKKLFGFIGGKIKISEKDTSEFFDELELSLLEADVEQDTSEAIVEELRERLVGKEISSREDVSEFLKNEVKGALEKIMATEKIDVLEISKKKKPLKILFLGPNGAGKTTTIAKVAKFFMNQGKSVILAAGDTFRAAAIDQLEEHGKKLGVKVIKHNYGSDPAAVAFDAVKAAEAKKIDVVLIDSAGRQDTNMNLIKELEKINRVVKPDLRLYVGEAYTGQALLQQATEFDRAIGVDGFVLTKIDTDVKGGTAISLLYKLKKPIVFVGTGQRYEDLLEFRPEFIIDRVL